MGEHVPVPQAWQFGQLAVAQQTMSTQLPIVHWVPLVHAWPFAFFGSQVPFAPVQ